MVSFERFLQYIIKCNIARYLRTVGHLGRIFRTIDKRVMPECEKCMLIVMRRNTGLGEARMEQLPQGAHKRTYL